MGKKPMPRKKRDKAPSMPFYGKDFYTDEKAMRLDWAHHGLYMRLLWWQWTETSIAADLKDIIDFIGKGRETKRLWLKVEPFFPVSATDRTRRQNQKLEQVRADQRAYKERFGGAHLGTNEGTKEVHKRDEFVPLAVAVPFASAFPEQETSLSSESRSSRGKEQGHDHNGRFPLWSQRQFQYKADKIAQWVKAQQSRTGPGEEDFEALFLETWSMSWTYWLAERDWHLEYFGSVAV